MTLVTEAVSCVVVVGIIHLVSEFVIGLKDKFEKDGRVLLAAVCLCGQRRKGKEGKDKVKREARALGL